MIPQLETLESRESPAAIDPIFAAGVTRLDQDLIGLYQGITSSLQQAQSLGIQVTAEQVQSVQQLGQFALEFPLQAYQAYQHATPAEIAQVDQIFLNFPPGL